MEYENQNFPPANQVPIKSVAWYAQRRYVYLILLLFVATGVVTAYFVMNQPQDLGPIIVNHKPKVAAQDKVATTTPTEQQQTPTTTPATLPQKTAPTPPQTAPVAPPQNTVAPKAVQQPTTASNPTASTAVAPNIAQPAPAAPAQRLVYTNAQYGFSLSFPSTWKGYTVTNETVPGTAGVFNFGFPQQKSIFMVVAYTRTMWDRQKHTDLTYYLGANDRYAFIYNPAQGGANQAMSDRLAELESIVATFSSH